MPNKAFPFKIREQLFLLAVVVTFVLFDLAVLPVEQLLLDALSFTVFGTCAESWVIGCYLAQVGILACWSAMFPGSILMRLLIANLLLVVVYFLIHRIMEHSFVDVLNMRQTWFKPRGWATLLVCLNATQIPLLVMRRATGYRVGLRGEAGAAGRLRQFSISEILGLMAFASVPLFILSAFLVPLKDAPFLAAIILSTGVMSWLYFWVFLRPRLSGLGIVFVLLLGPGIVWLVFGLCLGRWTENYQGTPVYWIYGSAYLGAITQVIFAALSARLFGYRLLKAEAAIDE